MRNQLILIKNLHIGIKLCSILCTPLAVVLHFTGIRFPWSGKIGQSSHHAIGHLLGEQYYLEKLHFESKESFRRFVLLIPRGEEANTYVLNLFPKTFIVVRVLFLCRILAMFQINPFTGINLYDVIWTETKAATIFKKTGKVDVQPLLQIPRIDANNLTNLLSNMGVPESGWYVCLQNREGGYNPSSESTHAFRNSTVQKFLPAVEYIAENGGYVIRMGESTVTPFPAVEGIFDYARSHYKSFANDILLASNCRFWVGGLSGAFAMSSVQGIPVAIVDAVPMGAAKVWGPRDIAVPKIYISRSSGFPIPFKEIFDSDLANIRRLQKFIANEVELVETPADEVLEAVREMLMQLEGTSLESESDLDLRRRFENLFDESNYSYYSKTKISTYFLRKYKHLLP